MAEDKNSGDGSSNHFVGESSNPAVELNIKTLDSQIYSFQVSTNVSVLSFKEKIADKIGVPVGHQRLIFRGRVLKDDHSLSEYHLENGHTLHLVVRQPTPSQPPSDDRSEETNETGGVRGNDSNARMPRGQISHSIVLGTFNVGDQSESYSPDISRVIGGVLNSLGIGTQPGSTGNDTASFFNAASHALQGVGAEGTRANLDGQSQGGNQAQSRQPSQPFQPSPQVVQVPLTAAPAIPLPSYHVPIPDSLTTLMEFMNNMEQPLSQSGYQADTSSTAADQRSTELPTNGRGLPTPEALSIVIQRAQQLLSSHASTALSRIAGSLTNDAAFLDPIVRQRVQTESVHLGVAMQHLGALLLELGRTMMTLRMGQSAEETFVYAGPPVYISSSGPNPIMVQPFPLQTRSLFGSATPPPNPVGPVGMGTPPRNINIHIHAGTSHAPVVAAVGNRSSSADRVQGERGSNTVTGSYRGIPIRHVFTTAGPSRSAAVGIPTVAQPEVGISASQPPDSRSIPPGAADINALVRNLARQRQNQFATGMQSTGSSNDIPSIAQSDVDISASQPPSDSASAEVAVVNAMDRNLYANQIDAGMQSTISNNDIRIEPPSNMVVGGTERSTDSLPRNPSDSDGPEPKPESNKRSKHEGTGSASTCSNEESTRRSEDASDNAFKPSEKPDASENALKSSERPDVPEGSKAIPLGLGLGSLEHKKRSKQAKPAPKNAGIGTPTSSRDQNIISGSSGQQLLQSLFSSNSALGAAASADPPFRQRSSSTTGEQTSEDQLDIAGAMSQFLQSPALDGLLSGMSGQTGAGSPNVLRNMLQQFTSNPQILNTVQQIAQQVDGEGLENMFSGSGGGGMDLSRMVQQMMPVVSRAISRGSAVSEPGSTTEAESQRHPDEPADQRHRMNIEQVAEMIGNSDMPGDVFRGILENAVWLPGGEASLESLVNDLCTDEDLASEYAEMLRRDINRRLQGESGKDNC